jgi:hypothetical protein
MPGGSAGRGEIALPQSIRRQTMRFVAMHNEI